jgi:hypothetical protein
MKITYLALFMLLTGCASLDGVSQSELIKPIEASSFTLKTDAIGAMTSTNGFGSATVYQTGLRAGKYHAVFMDSEGTYYQGGKDCVYSSLAYYKYLDGGIWIPQNGSGQEPRLWVYLKRLEPGDFGSGVLGAALANMNAGNVKKDLSTKVESFLLEQISIVKE